MLTRHFLGDIPHYCCFICHVFDSVKVVSLDCMSQIYMSVVILLFVDLDRVSVGYIHSDQKTHIYIYVDVMPYFVAGHVLKQTMS